MSQTLHGCMSLVLTAKRLRRGEMCGTESFAQDKNLVIGGDDLRDDGS